MRDPTPILIPPRASLREALQVIDRGRMQIALVVDESRRLLGTVSDGDIRRAILQGHELDASIEPVYHRRPVTAPLEASPSRLLRLALEKQIRQIPLIDADGIVRGIELIEDQISPADRPNRVVIMAGGLGTRLRPLTEHTPKPMLKVGGRPLLETLIRRFAAHGLRNIYLSVNYRAEIIEAHFGDGSAFGVHIHYLREPKRLGTAGALSLLPETPSEPLIVINGDILTEVNFAHLLDFHHGERAAATMGVRRYAFQVPYGVVRVEGQRLVDLEEKPLQRFFVNAGLYVLSPGSLTHIPKGEYFDMPQLFKRLIELGARTVSFPVHEYWLDIGRPEDYIKANERYPALEDTLPE